MDAPKGCRYKAKESHEEGSVSVEITINGARTKLELVIDKEGQIGRRRIQEISSVIMSKLGEFLVEEDRVAPKLKDKKLLEIQQFFKMLDSLMDHYESQKKIAEILGTNQSFISRTFAKRDDRNYIPRHKTVTKVKEAFEAITHQTPHPIS